MNQTKNEIAEIFEKEYSSKKFCYVKWKEAVVVCEDSALAVDLATCVSVLLAGQDDEGKVWMGLNHLFKCREENYDISLQHIAELRNVLEKEKKCGKTVCLGIFGAGYKENSLGAKIAKRNIENCLESLNLFGYQIELFLTGFSQSVCAVFSKEFKSFMIRNTNLENKDRHYYQISIDEIL